MRILLALTLAAALLSVNPDLVQAQTQPRIINGEPADSRDFGFVAALLDAGEFSKRGAYQAQFCGASLTSATTLVTAAHCVVDQKTGDTLLPEELLVSFGQQLKGPDLRIVKVDRIDIHPSYRLRTAANDIAVLTLTQPMSDLPTIPVVSIAQLEDYTAPGTNATVVGWGNTSATGNQFPDSLRSAQVVIFPGPSCGQGKPHELKGVQFKGFRSDEASPENMLCAAGVTANAEVIDACQGDSGGPLLVGSGPDRRLVGVVSWGERCASYFPGVYTRVSAELEFLRTTNAIPTIAPVSPPQVSAVGLDGQVRVTAVAPADGSAVTAFAVSVVEESTGVVRSCGMAPVRRSGTCTVSGLTNGTRYLVTSIYGSPEGDSPVSSPVAVIPSLQPVAGRIRTVTRDDQRVRFRVTASDTNGQDLISNEVVCTQSTGRVVRAAIQGGRARMAMPPGTYSCLVRIATTGGEAVSAPRAVRIKRS